MISKGASIRLSRRCKFPSAVGGVLEIPEKQFDAGDADRRGCCPGTRPQERTCGRRSRPGGRDRSLARRHVGLGRTTRGGFHARRHRDRGDRVTGRRRIRKHYRARIARRNQARPQERFRRSQPFGGRPQTLIFFEFLYSGTFGAGPLVTFPRAPIVGVSGHCGSPGHSRLDNDNPAWTDLKISSLFGKS